MIKTLVIASALAGATALAAPASAAPLSPSQATVAGAASAPLVEQVQWRRYGYYGPRYYGPRYYGGYRRGPAVGAGIAAGVIGGALAAGALAAPRPVYTAPAPAYGYTDEDVDAVAYCSRRFRTYNPETGTYIANGGVVRSCP